MGHLFYGELGGTSGLQIQSSVDPDLALFPNVLNALYWLGTEFSAGPSGGAWDFEFGRTDEGGFQSHSGKQVSPSPSLGLVSGFALAVRSGDVAAPSPAPIPEPTTILLLGSGILGLLGFRRKFKKS